MITTILFSFNKRENKPGKEKQLAPGCMTTDWQNLESETSLIYNFCFWSSTQHGPLLICLWAFLEPHYALFSLSTIGTLVKKNNFLFFFFLSKGMNLNLWSRWWCRCPRSGGLRSFRNSSNFWWESATTLNMFSRFLMMILQGVSLVHSGCYNKIPETTWLIIRRTFLLTVSEAERLRSACQRGWWGPFSGVQMSYCVFM